MKSILFSLIANLVAIICVSSAVFLAFHDKPGWGWFLFVGLCSAEIPTKFSDSK